MDVLGDVFDLYVLLIGAVARLGCIRSGLGIGYIRNVGVVGCLLIGAGGEVRLHESDTMTLTTATAPAP